MRIFSRQPIYTWLLAAFVIAAGIIVAGSVFASEIVPTDQGVLRSITNPLTATTVDLSNSVPTTGSPISARIVPKFSGVNTKFLVNGGASPFEIVGDSVVSGVLDLRNGIINNGSKEPQLIVSLAADTPAAGYVAYSLNTNPNNVTKIKFESPNAAIAITQLKIRQDGTAPYTVMSRIKIYSGGTLLGWAQPLGAKTTINLSTPLIIAEGGSQIITIQTNIVNGEVNNAATALKLGIESAADITATKEVIGSFPIYGNGFRVGLPDLVSHITVTSPAGTTAGGLPLIVQGIPFTITTWAENIGNTTVDQNAKMRVCENLDACYTVGNNRFDEYYVAGVTPGASSPVPNRPVDPAPVITTWPGLGENYIDVCADVSNDGTSGDPIFPSGIPELLENNNCARQRFMLVAPRLNVSLAADSPAAGPLQIPSAYNNITKITFASPGSDVEISQLKIKQNGTAPYTAISSIKIYLGNDLMGSATPSGTKTTINLTMPILIMAGGSQVITLKADIANVAANSGRTVKLGIESMADITTTGAVSGSFPIYGNAFSLVYVASALTFARVDSPPDSLNSSTPLDKRLLEFTVTGSNSAATITGIKVLKTGNGVTNWNTLKLYKKASDGTYPTTATATASALTSYGGRYFINFTGLSESIQPSVTTTYKVTGRVGCGDDYADFTLSLASDIATNESSVTKNGLPFTPVSNRQLPFCGTWQTPYIGGYLNLP